MTDDAPKPATPEHEEKAQEAQPTPETTGEKSEAPRAQEPASGGSFFGRWGWLLLLLVAIGAGLLLTPAEVRQQWLNSITGEKPAPKQPQPASTRAPAPQAERMTPPAPQPKQPPVTRQPQAPATPPASSGMKLANETESRATAPTRPEAPAKEELRAPAPAAIDEQEAQKLLSAMQGLQTELTSLRQEQKSLRQTQDELQRIQLRTRLRWIANPVNHLPQIELAWEEISRMPSLTPKERQQAQAMYALAQQRNNDIRRWQRALNEAAARLRPPAHENIVPTSKQPWLQWLLGQFSLRRAPGKEARQMTELQRELQKTARNLQLERWPDPLAWQKLRARVELALADLPQSKAEEMPKLPDNFSAIAHDITQLRQAAQTWQERL